MRSMCVRECMSVERGFDCCLDLVIRRMDDKQEGKLALYPDFGPGAVLLQSG